MAVNQLWVADITYVRMNEEFVYLAVILDAFSRRVVGWAMADHLRAELALAALDMAMGHRCVTSGELVHHSDQGVQYACGDYLARLERSDIQPSMSRPGCPWDNAMAESFMRTLKREEVNGRAYRDRAEAEASIGAFIEKVYNRQRLHSALSYLAPEAYRNAPGRFIRYGVADRPAGSVASGSIHQSALMSGSVFISTRENGRRSHGLLAWGRPQARRLRRPATRLRGLTSASRQQPGIGAVDAWLCPLPGSGDRWDAWMRVRAIGQRKTGSRALPLKPHQGALPLGTPPRAEPLEPITWLDAGTGGKARRSSVHDCRGCGVFAACGGPDCGGKIGVWLISVSHGWGVAPVGSNQPVSSLRSILPSFGALPDPAERPRTSVREYAAWILASPPKPLRVETSGSSKTTCSFRSRRPSRCHWPEAGPVDAGAGKADDARRPASALLLRFTLC